jgi:hypothetical protein
MLQKARSEAAEAEEAAGRALEAGHAEVMKMRRRFQEVEKEVMGLEEQRGAIIAAFEDERNAWERQQQVTPGDRVCATSRMFFVLQVQLVSFCDMTYEERGWLEVSKTARWKQSFCSRNAEALIVLDLSREASFTEC